MRPVIRYQSHLLFRKSYKPDRRIRLPLVAGATHIFRPARTGTSLKAYEYS